MYNRAGVLISTVGTSRSHVGECQSWHGALYRVLRNSQKLGSTCQQSPISQFGQVGDRDRWCKCSVILPHGWQEVTMEADARLSFLLAYAQAGQ